MIGAMDSPPVVSVVIPVRNGADTIGLQLAALSAQDFADDWEVVVVDHRSTDSTRDVVEQFSGLLPGLRIVSAPEGDGVSVPRNVGLREANGTYMLVCDADDEVCRTWIRSLVTGLVDADLVAGSYGEGKFNSPEMRQLRNPRPDRLPRPLGFLPYAMGANFGVKVAVARDLGGWDEEFKFGGEDVDFSWRLQLAGYEIAYAADARVEYRHRAGMRALWKQFYRYGTNRPLLYRKFRAEGLRRPTPVVVAKGWGWIVLHTIDLTRGAGPRSRWIRRAASAAGRGRGSLKHRTLYL